jgi:hypothetical protein
MTTYFRVGKATPVNYIGRQVRTSFRQGDTVITSAIAIDDIQDEVEFVEPAYRIEEKAFTNTVVYHSFSTGIDIPSLQFPEHPLKSGVLWRYVMGTVATTSSYKHTITVANAFPNVAFHGEMEHATTAKSKRLDFLGIVNENAMIRWGQTQPTTASYSWKVGKTVSGSDLARPTELDLKASFLPGQFSTTLLYNSNSVDVTWLGGSIECRNRSDFFRVGDEYPTEALWTRKDYLITLEFMAYDKDAIDIPRKPESYAGAITLAQKVYRNSTTDYMNFSFTNLFISKQVHAKKVAEADYYYHNTIELKAAGARTGIAANTTTLTVVDDISGGKYTS